MAKIWKFVKICTGDYWYYSNVSILSVYGFPPPNMFNSCPWGQAGHYQGSQYLYMLIINIVNIFFLIPQTTRVRCLMFCVKHLNIVVLKSVQENIIIIIGSKEYFTCYTFSVQVDYMYRYIWVFEINRLPLLQ